MSFDASASCKHIILHSFVLIFDHILYLLHCNECFVHCFNMDLDSAINNYT